MHPSIFTQRSEARDGLGSGARITPIRQEQLKNRLGDRFHELDVSLLVEWPDGKCEALLFVLEEETNPTRFSIHRLAHYCLDLAELFGTDRVVPVVIFLRDASALAACWFDALARWMLPSYNACNRRRRRSWSAGAITFWMPEHWKRCLRLNSRLECRGPSRHGGAADPQNPAKKR